MKIRAWHKRNKFMREVDIISFRDGWVGLLDGSDGCYLIGEVILMIASDLIDKNSTEIYDGDLCQIFNNAGDIVVSRNGEPVISEVKFQDGCFMLFTDTPVKDWCPDHIEIAGNIYEGLK